MEKFRNLTNNIFFKIFLGLVGLSFVMFGVSGFLLENPNAWILKVDGQKIPYNSFLQITQKNRERIYRSNPNDQVLQYLNSEQFKVDTLNQLVREKITDNVQQYYGIYPDKELILKSILSQLEFTDFKGDFNRIAFLNFLKINNLTEEKYIADRSRIIANQIVMDALLYTPKENDRLIKAIYNNQYEKRAVGIISISLNDIKISKNPTSQQLAEFFEKHKKNFALPEMRKVSYIEFTENDIISNQNLTEEEKEDLINKKIEEIEDYALTSNSLSKLAKKFNFKVNSLEAFDKNGLDINHKNIVGKVADLDEFVKNSFSISTNETSEIFNTKLGKYYILFVDSVEKSQQRNLNEVKDLATKQYVENEKQKLFKKLSQEIYSQIQNGQKSLDSILAKNNLKISRTEILSNDNINPANKNFYQDLFNIKIVQATHPRKISENQMEIAVLQKIIYPEADKAKLNALKQKLSDEFKINTLNSYNNYLQKKFTVEINEKLLNNNSDEQ